MFIRPIIWWKRVALLLIAAVVTLSVMLVGTVALAPQADATYTKRATISASAECVNAGTPDAVVYLALTVVNPGRDTIIVSTPAGPLVVPGNQSWVSQSFPGVNGENSGVAEVTFENNDDWYYDKSYDLPWSVFADCTPTKPPVVTPPTVKKAKYKLRVTDRCKCKHDSVRVVGKHIAKVKIKQSKNHFTITVTAKPGFKVPAKPGSDVFVSKTTFKYATTNKPCRCKKTGTCKPTPQTCKPVAGRLGRCG